MKFENLIKDNCSYMKTRFGHKKVCMLCFDNDLWVEYSKEHWDTKHEKNTREITKPTFKDPDRDRACWEVCAYAEQYPWAPWLRSIFYACVLSEGELKNLDYTLDQLEKNLTLLKK